MGVFKISAFFPPALMSENAKRKPTRIRNSASASQSSFVCRVCLASRHIHKDRIRLFLSILLNPHNLLTGDERNVIGPPG